MTHIWLETAGRAGEFVASEALVVPVGDRGLAYGDGLFETVRVSRGVPLFLSRHLRRLLAGLASLGFPPPVWNEVTLADRCRQVIARNDLVEGVLKLMVTRGSGPRGFDPPAEAEAVLIIQMNAAPSATAKPAAGLRASLAPWRVDPASPLCYVKHLSGLDKVLARGLARQAGADECLFLNLAGQLTEGAASNLFLVLGGQIVTPRVDCGLLPGIARELLLESNADLPLPVIETALPVESLAQASEAFLTNAVMGVRPLIEVDGRPIGDGQAGPITTAAAEHYQRLAEAEANHIQHL